MDSGVGRVAALQGWHHHPKISEHRWRRNGHAMGRKHKRWKRILFFHEMRIRFLTVLVVLSALAVFAWLLLLVSL